MLTAAVFHRLDSFDALRDYGQLLRRRGVAIPDSSSDYAHEPYWKSWGFVERFTVGNILAALPELKSMGIRVANVDMGWYDYMGDWQINREPGKFPNGEPDLIALVTKLHARGLQDQLLVVSDRRGDRRAGSPKERKRPADRRRERQQPGGDQRTAASSARPMRRRVDHIRQVLTRAVSVWGFDGAYSDYQAMSAVPAVLQSGAPSQVAARLLPGDAEVLRDDP